MTTELVAENEPRATDAQAVSGTVPPNAVRPRRTALRKALCWVAGVVLVVCFGFPLLWATLTDVRPPARIFMGDLATAEVRSPENPTASPAATPGPSQARPVATALTR